MKFIISLGSVTHVFCSLKKPKNQNGNMVCQICCSNLCTLCFQILRTLLNEVAEAATGGVLQISQENICVGVSLTIRPVTLLKRGSNTGVFLGLLWNC